MYYNVMSLMHFGVILLKSLILLQDFDQYWCVLLLFIEYLHFLSDLFMLRVKESWSLSQHAFGKRQ